MSAAQRRRPPSLARLVLALARFAIRLHPAEYRAQFADEVELFVEERLRSVASSSLSVRLAVSWAVLRDQMHSLLEERFSGPPRSARRPLPVGSARLLDSLHQDLRSAARLLRRRPAHTLLGAATLGIGVGACTLFFSLADAVMLRPLPFAEPDRLVALWNRYGESRTSLSPPDYADRRDRATLLDRSAAYSPASVGLAGPGEPRQVVAHRVTQAFFDVLGVEPMLGRVVLPADEGAEAGDQVVLSHRLWSSAFGADPGVLGGTVRIDGEPRRIAAVMPTGLDFPAGTDLWLPLVFTSEQLADDNRGNENLGMIARLAPGATLDGARAELESIAAGVIERVPQRADFLLRTGWGADVETLDSLVLGPARPLLRLLTLAVALVLVVACVNVAHLQLDLASSRTAEMGLRACLGAGRPRLARQLLAESLALGVSGALAGIALATIGVRLLPAALPADLPRASEMALDLRALGVGVALALASSVAIGLPPAWLSAGPGERGGPRPGIGAASHRRFRRGLVVSEVALAVLLVAIAGLLLRGFLRLSAVDPGFSTESRVAFRVTLPPSELPTRDDRLRFVERLLGRLEALPEVDRAAAADRIPLEGRQWTGTFHPEGWQAADGEPPPGAELNLVSQGFFDTLGVPLLAGRDFEAGDLPGSPRVLIVDQSTQRRFFPAGAVGRRIAFAAEPTEDDWREIVGVVARVRVDRLDEDAGPQVYLPVSQVGPRELAFVVRTRVGPESLRPRLRREVAALVPELPIYDERTLGEIHRRALALPRVQASALGVFALVAVLLAAVGVFGVLAMSVSERKPEIGLRMALGATAAQVARRVLLECLALVLGGAALGLLASQAAGRLLEGSLYGLQARDAGTLGLVVALCAIGGVALALVPAHRAARVDPVVALRAD
ncbi:MAG TPA: ABC transporter permease [Thermoanaerobaculia bacterium]|nr:ABC transporter permease [Thermoanaerobaculia bacterium]